MMQAPRGATGVGNQDRGQTECFMPLIYATVALLAVSTVLLFGADIAGSFANGLPSPCW